MQIEINWLIDWLIIEQVVLLGMWSYRAGGLIGQVVL